MLRYTNSAFRHGIIKSQIQEVLANRWGTTKWFQIHNDDYDNSQDMILGFDAKGILIEVGLAYIDDDEVVFHADKATLIWRNRYVEDR